MDVISVQATEIFLGPEDAPRQVLRITLTGVAARTPVSVEADQVSTPTPALTVGAPELVLGQSTVEVTEVVEVGIRTDLPAGSATSVRVRVGDALGAERFAVTIAEPGWTMVMVSHFHYDPVWWNTQAAYTSEWDRLDFDGSPRGGRQQDGFALVQAHLDIAKRDPDYAFVLAELDYLKPFWDCYPERRDDLRRLLAEGRLELVGGTYNEPNTNLTAAETTVRNLVSGMGFQRDVLGAAPATAWQLDAFGHDPQFPGMVHDAGLTSSSWARGPYHQWGPMLAHWDREKGDAAQMQFPAEFEWISPSGRGVTTAYMVFHYSAGWVLDSCGDLESAMAAAYEVFLRVKPVGAARAVLLPVGGDYTPPNQWVTGIHREWNSRYVWPRFVSGTPRQFFALVTDGLAASERTTSPQTRDMNPVYTGKDVSYIDTKQAHRAAENRLMDAEKFATLACLLGLGRFPHGAVDKAWRQLSYGAHHDAITGSEGDQVYLDLVTGWRDAYELAAEVERQSLTAIAASVDTAGPGVPVVVFNSQSWVRSDIVRVVADLTDLTAPVVVDEHGDQRPVVVEGRGSDGRSVLRFLATSVPGIGYRTFHIVSGGSSADWVGLDGVQIGNQHYRVSADAARGGALDSIVELRSGRQLLAAGEVGNELVVHAEYPDHPTYFEGPWHLTPTGARSYGRDGVATVRAQRSGLGERLVISGQVGPAAYTQIVTLWTGVDRIDCRTRLDFTGTDQLVRVRFPCPVAGALPVSEVGNAAIGRGFASIDVDSAEDPYTLDNPAYNWFGLSTTMRVRIGEHDRAIGIAEVVCPDGSDHSAARGLVVALVGQGVTSSCSSGDGWRYGRLDLDSNLPDVRVALGTPAGNSFVRAVLQSAAPEYAAELDRQLAATGEARVWVPAARPLAEVWEPSADLTAVDALDVLILAGTDLPGVLDAVVEDIADSVIEVDQDVVVSGAAVDDRTVGLLNRGIPGFAVTSDGALNLSLVRSCTGWPSGVWIDPPRRTTVDGSGFQLQHWTHELDYALVSGAGDWRDAGLVEHGHGFNHELQAVVPPSSNETIGGRLPTDALVGVEGSFVLTTIKPAGNAIARGSGNMPDPAGSIALRGYEGTGVAGPVRITLPVEVVDAHTATLLDEPLAVLRRADSAFTMDVTPYDIRTAVVDVGAASAAVPGPVLGPEHETVQPVYTRYWLHNSGPAAIGFQPVSVHLHPSRFESDVARPVRLRATVTNDLVDRVQDGVLSLGVPDGWVAEPTECVYSLDPGAFAEYDLTVTPSAGSVGTFAVDGTITDGVQTYVDTTLLTLGEPTSSALIEVEAVAAVSVVAGQVGFARALVHNRSSSPARVQVWPVSPWGSWDAVPVREYAVDVPPLSAVELAVEVTPPADAASAQTWLLFKAAWSGCLSYSETVPLRILGPVR